MDNYRNDAMLMEVLQNRKTITGFLDSIFGFLRRNTDFYHSKEDVADNIGFTRGMRDQLLFNAIQRYDPDCCPHTKGSSVIDHNNGLTAPPAIEEITIKSEEISDSQKNCPTKMLKSSAFSINDYKNGASFETHCWSQSLNELEIHVRLPSELKAAKQLSIDIKPQYMKVINRCNPKQVILAGNLSQRIKHNEVVWTVDQDRLIICCDKSKEFWWDRLFDGDPEIDLRKINCERYIDELPEQSQVAIEKLRTQQLASDQKQIQSPEQTETMKRLKIAWNVEGSPFKGKPFDPTLVKMS